MRRRERRLDGPGWSKTRTRYTLSSVVLSLISPSHHNPPSPLAPNVGFLGEHRVAVAVKSLRAWDASVALRQKTLAVVPGKLTLCRTNAHPAVKTFGLAVLVRSSGPITQNVDAREL